MTGSGTRLVSTTTIDIIDIYRLRVYNIYTTTAVKKAALLLEQSICMHNFMNFIVPLTLAVCSCALRRIVSFQLLCYFGFGCFSCRMLIFYG